MFNYKLRHPTFNALLIGCLLALALVSVVAVTVLGARFVGRAMEHDAQEHLGEAALRVREGLDSFLKLHQTAIHAVARSTHPVGRGGRLDRAAIASELEDAAALYPGFLTLLAADKDGRIVRAVRRGERSFTPGETENQTVADRPYFLEPRRTRRAFVSGVFRGRGLGQDPIVAVSAPLMSGDGSFAGVIEGSIDIRAIPLAPVSVHHSPVVIACDASGTIVYSTQPEAFPPLAPWKGDRMNSTPGNGESSRLSVEYPLDGLEGWRVIAFLPPETVRREVRSFYWNAAVALVLVILLNFLVARRVARALSRPVASLAREMQQYRLDGGSGESNDTARFAPLEIARIQDEFRTLSDRLRDSYRQLWTALEDRDRTNRQLQHVLDDLDRKVTERTRELAESESRYRHVVENSGDLIFRTDSCGRLTFHNAAFEALLGCSAIGRKMQDFIEPVTREHVRQEALRQLKHRTPLVYLEYAIMQQGGALRWLGQGTQLLFDDTGRPCGFQAIARDITEKKLAEVALREAEERYALAVSGSNNGIWDWDLRTGRVYFSERWWQMLGLETSAEPKHQIETWLERVHPNDSARVREELASYARAGFDLFECEHRLRHADGTWRWVLTTGAAVRGPAGEALRIAGSTTDVTLGKLVDALTGLPNRLAVIDRLDRLVTRQKEDPSRFFAVLFMDLDRFKLINDSLGHLKGDLLLLTVSRRLGSALALCGEGSGCVGRLGGDEFVVVLDNSPAPESAIQLAQAIQHEMEAPMHLDGSLVFSSMSIGIAHSGQGMQTAEDALRNADTAMYHAKAEGRGRIGLFDSSMHARAIARLELETDLRRALDAGEFVLCYQPQVDLHTGRLAGFEALVRWNHPARGLVAPSEFIWMAEENGLILALGRWVIETGCRQLAEWDQSFEPARQLSVSINLSARQFNDPKLDANVAAILRDTGLEPSRLHLEVTESMVADDPDSAHRILKSLSDMGVGLEVDDFGTGYSCLGQLHQLPFDTLKIDRSFVNALGNENQPEQDSRKIVESIVRLSSSLGIDVIAEGIETEGHWAQLAALGCDYGQGFHFARPLLPDEAYRTMVFRSEHPWVLRSSGLAPATAGILELSHSLARNGQRSGKSRVADRQPGSEIPGVA
jgi:diguanylate cyclase (GGDEF)-like protein/PAS domain S-box-containing protein